MTHKRAESTFTARSVSRGLSTSPSFRATSSPELEAPDIVTTLPFEVEDAEPEARVSFYVEAIDEMIDAVLLKEAFLFSAHEVRALQRVRSLEYEARYLFARFYLRKPGWFRLSDIGYESDVGDLEGACEVLCERFKRFAKKQEEETPVAGPSTQPAEEMIDLTMDDDDDGEEDELLLWMAVDEKTLAELSNEEILSLLSVDELEELAKKFKLKPKKRNKKHFIELFTSTASNQTTLSFTPIGKGKAKATIKTDDDDRPKKKLKGAVQIERDSAGRLSSQTRVIVGQALKILGQCIRLSPAFISLFDRLSLVYHRTAFTSSSGTSSLTASLLARFGKRRYPEYEVKRTFSIFASREDLIAYEEALKIEQIVDDALGDNYKKGWNGKLPEEIQKEREENWKDAIAQFDGVYKKWKQFCREGAQEESEQKNGSTKRLLYYRKRFHPGWPMTRVVWHASAILAKLGNHDREKKVLGALLAQTTFQRGKRGAWADRLALVLQKYPSAEEEKEKSPKKKKKMAEARMEEALAVCVAALADEYTHQIYVDSLQRRVRRIESAREVPKAQRRTFDRELTTATRVIYVGERLDEPVIGKKSVWKGDDDTELSVEEFALSLYEDKGWKGFHSENSILKTIFSLVFWDILFTPIDGVFETAFQAAPLDLTTDAFYTVRQSLIEARLTEVSKGKSTKYLTINDDRERPTETWCVGVNWTYTKKDLLEIIKCIGGEALAFIFRVFVEEYGHRSSGMPDLFLWDPSDNTCKFVEVKGPGDRLSETQRCWIDILLRAGIEVDVAAVMTAEDHDEMERRKEERAKVAAEKKRKKKEGEESGQEESDA